MTFPIPPFPTWVRWAGRSAELVCDLAFLGAAGAATRGAPVSVAQGFGGLEWLWPALLGVGGAVAAAGTVTARLGAKLAGAALSAGGLLSYVAALLVADGGPTTGQVTVVCLLVAAVGLLVYRVIVQLAMTHLEARRQGAAVSN